MPSYPPRNEPIKKIEILEKRIRDLQRSKEKGESVLKVNNKCEKVRNAKLNLIKAKLALLKSYRSEDENPSKILLIKKSEEEFDTWKLISNDDIIIEYCD